MSTDLAPLIARVETATGPDRRLDLDICAALGTLEYGPTARGWTRHPHPELTASLDAALALVERVLPGWVVRLDLYGKHASAGLEPPWTDDMRGEPPGQRAHSADAASPALALILALLRALQAQASESNRKDGSSPQNNLSPTLEKGKE